MKMKGLSGVAWKSVVSLTVVYWMATSSSSLRRVFPPLDHFKDFFLQILEPRIERNVIKAPETFMSTSEIIRNRGYPLEKHSVTTKDGYILELHRIPHGIRNEFSDTNQTVQRRAVFLQHGMMGSDHFWIFNPSNNSLAFMLADYGYDVWMGNSRGNVYSRKHVALDPEEEEYWNFSWDEMGRYDIPASIDYVLNVTAQDKLAAYFGYSLGCSVFYIAAIEEPRMNEKVEVMVALGPTVSVANLGNFFRFLAPFVRPYQFLQRFFGATAIHTNDGLPHQLLRLFCETSHFRAEMCKHVLFQIFGYSETYYESTIFTIAGHYPSGGSVNTMAHLLQNYNSGEVFNAFDYGADGNLERYGTPHPAEYNLSLVTAPVYLIGADSDPFSPPKDVSWLASKLGNCKGSIRVNSTAFSHGDFVWSPRAAELVHRPAIDLLPSPYIQN